MLSAESRHQDFPGLEAMTYLNTAAEGIPPRVVGEAIGQYFRDKQLGMDGRDLHFAQWDAARSSVGRMFGLSADEVGICSCSSEAYNLAAMALKLQSGDEVIINDLDFPAGATPWLQGDCAATVQLWQARNWALHLEDLAALLGPQTRLVTTSLVSFYNGFMVPLPELVALVRERSDALLAVDVTQALGRVPLDLTGVDLVISSTHKWILSSHGGGLVGIPSARAQDWVVPAGGWFNQPDAFGPDRFQHVDNRPGAPGFTVGMPNFMAVYAIQAALTYLESVGVEQIEHAARPLVDACCQGLAELPVELLTPLDQATLAGIVAFRHPQAEQLQTRLRANNIHVMCQAGRMRIALHGYNTLDDVDKLLTTLKTALAELT